MGTRAALALILASLAASYSFTVDAKTPVLSSQGSLWTINTVKVKKGMLDQARKYYAKKWLPARKVALSRGYLKSYAMLTSPGEDANSPEIVLMTEYADRQTYADREKNFQAIFKELGVAGDVTVDGLGRNDILGESQGLEDYQVVEASR